MDPNERAALIARYRSGVGEVVDALTAITDEELDRPQADPSAWTARQVVHRLHYDRPIESSVAVVGAVRAASLDLLEHLTADEWNRRGTHTESGAYDVATWLRIYADHPRDHADQIRAARAAPPID